MKKMNVKTLCEKLQDLVREYRRENGIDAGRDYLIQDMNTIALMIFGEKEEKPRLHFEIFQKALKFDKEGIKCKLQLVIEE